MSDTITFQLEGARRCATVENKLRTIPDDFIMFLFNNNEFKYEKTSSMNFLQQNFTISWYLKGFTLFLAIVKRKSSQFQKRKSSPNEKFRWEFQKKVV